MKEMKFVRVSSSNRANSCMRLFESYGWETTNVEHKKENVDGATVEQIDFSFVRDSNTVNMEGELALMQQMRAYWRQCKRLPKEPDRAKIIPRKGGIAFLILGLVFGALTLFWVFGMALVIAAKENGAGLLIFFASVCFVLSLIFLIRYIKGPKRYKAEKAAYEADPEGYYQKKVETYTRAKADLDAAEAQIWNTYASFYGNTNLDMDSFSKYVWYLENN